MKGVSQIAGHGFAATARGDFPHCALSIVAEREKSARPRWWDDVTIQEIPESVTAA
jgi:hypothetical protein